jgi:hypothetical protein
VIAWLVRNDAELALPTITIAEIAFGIGKIRPRPLTSPFQDENLGSQFGWLLEGGHWPPLLRRRSLSRRCDEDRDRDRKGHQPIVAPWIKTTGALLPDGSGGRRRVYAGICTFISVMPWIRFE